MKNKDKGDYRKENLNAPEQRLSYFDNHINKYPDGPKPTEDNFVSDNQIAQEEPTEEPIEKKELLQIPYTDSPTNDNVPDGDGLIPTPEDFVKSEEEPMDDKTIPDADDFDEGNYEDIDDIGGGEKL